MQGYTSIQNNISSRLQKHARKAYIYFAEEHSILRRWERMAYHICNNIEGIIFKWKLRVNIQILNNIIGQNLQTH